MNFSNDIDYGSPLGAFAVSPSAVRPLPPQTSPFLPVSTRDLYNQWQAAVAAGAPVDVIVALRERYDAAVARQQGTTGQPSPLGVIGPTGVVTAPAGPPAVPLGAIAPGGPVLSSNGTTAPATTAAPAPGMASKIGTVLLLTAPAWGAWLYLRYR